MRLCRILRHVSSELEAWRTLGVAPGTPHEQVRQKFHELTRLYHPDMPNGDTTKFREIHAAYHQLRRLRGKPDTGSTNHYTEEESLRHPTGEAFWAEQNQKIYEEYNHRQAEWKIREENVRHAGRKKKRPGVIKELLWIYGGYELAVSLSALMCLCIYALQRYSIMVQRAAEKKRAVRFSQDIVPTEDVAASTSVQGLESGDGRELVLSDAGVTLEPATVQELSYRRVTQRRYTDFREFLFVHDPDGVIHRRVFTSRFSFQYVDEDAIPKCCPVVREFDSEKTEERYALKEPEISKTLRETLWSMTDASVAGPLMSKGLSCIPANSPNTAKWTFIEYQAGTDKKTPPVCLAAIRNKRYSRVGMCQRIIVTGHEGLQSKLVAKRKADLESGALSKKALVNSKPVPLKDLSVSLEKMKL